MYVEEEGAGRDPVTCSALSHQELIQFMLTRLWQWSLCEASHAEQAGVDRGAQRFVKLELLWPNNSRWPELFTATDIPGRRCGDTSHNSSRTLPSLHLTAIKTFVKEDLTHVLWGAMLNRLGYFKHSVKWLPLTVIQLRYHGFKQKQQLTRTYFDMPGIIIWNQRNMNSWAKTKN